MKASRRRGHRIAVLCCAAAVMLPACRDRAAPAAGKGTGMAGASAVSGARDPSDLVTSLASADGGIRADASRDLLAGGAPARAALERAGAKPLAGLSPPRMDAVYTLLVSPPTSPHRADSLGLNVELAVDRASLVEMGRRTGFELEAGASPNHAVRPNCYVRVTPGHAVEDVMRALLTRERSVVGVTYNFVDQTR